MLVWLSPRALRNGTWVFLFHATILPNFNLKFGILVQRQPEYILVQAGYISGSSRVQVVHDSSDKIKFFSVSLAYLDLLCYFYYVVYGFFVFPIFFKVFFSRYD